MHKKVRVDPPKKILTPPHEAAHLRKTFLYAKYFFFSQNYKKILQAGSGPAAGMYIWSSSNC